MCLVGNKRADIARVIPCKNNFCTKFAHRFHFCGLQKLNTLNLRLFHPPLNPCNHFPTVLIKTNWYTISYKFEFCFSLKSLVLSKSLTSIGDWAFNMAESLESLVIPDSVTSIGDYAFSGCRSLKSLVISNSVTHIAVGAFLSCTSLSSVVIPDGVTSIGEGAFIGCESLKSIDIPDGVVSIEKDAFRDCNFPNDFKQKLISRFGEEIFK